MDVFKYRVRGRIHRSDYGYSIKQYAFDIIDSVVESKLREEIEQKVMFFKPRVELKEVSFKVINEKDVLFICLDYIIRQTNQRTSMVYPLHLTQIQDWSKVLILRIVGFYWFWIVLRESLFYLASRSLK